VADLAAAYGGEAMCGRLRSTDLICIHERSCRIAAVTHRGPAKPGPPRQQAPLIQPRSLHAFHVLHALHVCFSALVL